MKNSPAGLFSSPGRGSWKKSGPAGPGFAQPVLWIVVVVLLAASAGAAWYTASTKREINRLLATVSEQGIQRLHGDGAILRYPWNASQMVGLVGLFTDR